MKNVNINENCPCTNTNCTRHGKCEECREHHKNKGGLPFCERPKQDTK